MAFKTVDLEEIRKDFEVVVEKSDGHSTEWTATVVLASHSGVGPASGVTIDIAVSARTGEAKYTCKPTFWGSKLPELVPALHEAVMEYVARH